LLVTFKTKAYSNITMFGDVAVRLLELMGLSGHVPGAISAEDIPGAVSRLRGALDALDGREGPDDAGGEEEKAEEGRVSLRRRAWPLIELLEAAAVRGEYVVWSS